ncbi:MAG TPA: TadE/TadG family type IV pilus assembly protein [Terriglobia bacterium]|nr:TadE/TadG family type IV pilus assembly protein [Terriglobia bacterium]
MMTSRINQRGTQKGQSLVEMALVCLIFFFLLFGILEFARALWTYNTIVQSTRQAARWAVVNVANAADTTDINRARNIVIYGYPDVGSGTPLVPGLDTATVTVQIQPLQTDFSGTAVSEKISVSVSNYQFQFIVPIAPTLTIPAFETTLYTESKGNFPA